MGPISSGSEPARLIPAPPGYRAPPQHVPDHLITRDRGNALTRRSLHGLRTSPAETGRQAQARAPSQEVTALTTTPQDTQNRNTTRSDVNGEIAHEGSDTGEDDENLSVQFRHLMGNAESYWDDLEDDDQFF